MAQANPEFVESQLLAEEQRQESQFSGDTKHLAESTGEVATAAAGVLCSKLVCTHVRSNLPGSVLNTQLHADRWLQL
jgi:hypothetical protein